MSNWISVKERLPEESGFFITWQGISKYIGRPEILYYHKDEDDGFKWSTTKNGWTAGLKITHWMPLPEPPEEE